MHVYLSPKVHLMMQNTSPGTPGAVKKPNKHAFLGPGKHREKVNILIYTYPVLSNALTIHSGLKISNTKSGCICYHYVAL